MHNKISIIIPTFNEAAGIGKLLAYLDANSTQGLIREVIIADGGSHDSTCTLAEATATKNFKVYTVKASKGRAKQQNQGARQAKSAILYFLHADSFPPKGFDTQILKAVEKGYSAGCFRLEFDEPHLLLKCSQWFTRFNFPLCRGGDQSLFIMKDLFEKMGGFNEEYIIYEDGEFHGRLYDNKVPFKVLQPAILTSSRRYLRIGFWKLQYHYARVHLMHRCGYGPKTLYNYYLRNIS